MSHDDQEEEEKKEKVSGDKSGDEDEAGDKESELGLDELMENL